MSRRLRYLVILLTFGFSLTVYLTVFPENYVEYQSNNKKEAIFKQSVVAYSLLKQMETDSEEVFCEKLSRGLPGEASSYGGVIWTKIPGVELYIYSVYKDTRLEPYVYWRILGMIKGMSSLLRICCDNIDFVREFVYAF